MTTGLPQPKQKADERYDGLLDEYNALEAIATKLARSGNEMKSLLESERRSKEVFMNYALTFGILSVALAIALIWSLNK